MVIRAIIGKGKGAGYTVIIDTVESKAEVYYVAQDGSRYSTGENAMVLTENEGE